MPDDYAPMHPVPLIVLLHGARGKRGLEVPANKATKRGVAVLVPDSRGSTWDLITSGFTAVGLDVAFIDRALQSTFSSIAVDPRHIALAGLRTAQRGEHADPGRAFFFQTTPRSG
ncbi:MAG: hypothetical protein H0T11_04860 [Chthoniobacterales bacterium]|nr:hypothetical protein [Chthoniobacterales bacterium]